MTVETRPSAGFFVSVTRTLERLPVGRLELHTPLNVVRHVMTPETEGMEDEGPINDPGNEDPGSLMDDATVPLNDADDAGDVGNCEYDEYDEEDDE